MAKYELLNNVTQRVIDESSDPFSYLIIYSDNTFKLTKNRCHGFWYYYGSIETINDKQMLNLSAYTFDKKYFEIVYLSENKIKIIDWSDCGMNQTGIYERVKCEEYIVIKDKILLKELPIIDAKTLTTLNKNTTVQLIEYNKENIKNGPGIYWVRIKTEKGVLGWCPLYDLKRIDITFYE